MPFGFYPSVGGVADDDGIAARYFKEYDEAMAPALEASKRAAEERYHATVAMTQDVLDRVQGMQNPYPQLPVPEIDPITAAAAGFFAHLNQAQGGGGQAVAGLQNTLANTMAQGQRAQAANAAAAGEFALGKQRSTEELHVELLKAQRDRAAEAGDLDKTFQHNKALYALERQRRKEELELFKQKEGVKGAQKITEIKERGAQARQTAGVIAQYRKQAAGTAKTPAQQARLKMADAEAAELRASVDDYRSARDIAGELMHTEEEIQAREAEVTARIRALYQEVITEFLTPEEKKDTPPPPGAANPPNPTPAGSSDAVRAAAERLRGTALFQQ